MQAENNANVVLLGIYDLFVISVAEEGEERTLNTQRRFNNVGDVVLVFLLIEVGQILA